MGHTPGPWRVDCNQWGTMPWSGWIVRTCNDGDNGESDPDGLMIVGVGDCGWDDLKHNMPIIGPQLSEADACLIAAAPDLLAALKDAANELNRIRARDGVPYTADGHRSDVSEEWFSQVVENGFNAIAKATGATP